MKLPPGRRSRPSRRESAETPPERSSLRRMLLTRPIVTGFTVTIGVIIAIALATAIASVSSVLMTVFLGLFLALGLDPAVGALERRRIPRGWGITIVAVAFVVVVAVVVLLVVPPTIRQFGHLVVSAPDAVEAFQESEWFTSLEDTLDTDLSAAIADSVRSFTNVSNFLAVSGGVLRAGFSIAGAISTGFMVVVLTLYFVSALPMMKESLARLQPAYNRDRFWSSSDHRRAPVKCAELMPRRSARSRTDRIADDDIDAMPRWRRTPLQDLACATASRSCSSVYPLVVPMPGRHEEPLTREHPPDTTKPW